MATVLTVNGTAVSVPGDAVLGRLTAFARGGYPSLTIYRRGATLAAPPDPWAAKAVSLAVNGTTYFVGDVVEGPIPDYVPGVGWVQAFQCLGLHRRADRVPVTDENTGLDRVGFNLQPEDPDYLAARAGRTVGQMLTAVLTMPTNAQNLNAYGIGQYTGLPSAPALPAATVADLAAMTMIPPQPTYLGGEKMWAAVVGFCEANAPNHVPNIEPDGTLRFFDQRTGFAGHTFTVGTDPIDVGGLSLSRRYGDCAQRVLVRGQPWVVAWLVDTLNGGLVEDFGYTDPRTGTVVSSAAAKAAYVPGQPYQTGPASDTGTCTCPSTTTVTVTSSDPAAAWPANYWDQSGTGALGWFYGWYSVGSGINQAFSSPIVSNTAKSAGGTSTLTLANAMPITNYDHYSIYGLAQGKQAVYRKYKVADPTVAAALARQFPAPVPFALAGGEAETLVSEPTGSVLWPSYPGNEVFAPIVVDPTSGHVYFNRPTYETAGNSVPYDVRALLAVNTGALRAVYPADGGGGTPNYAGTSHTIEGLSNTLVITVDAWRDPGQASQMATYAREIHDSVSSTIVEGTIPYLGLYEPALTMGVGASVAAPYATGWEGLALPVVQVDLEWPLDGPLDHVTTMHCSNRRQALGSGSFLRPARCGQPIGADFSPFSRYAPEAPGLPAPPPMPGADDEGEAPPPSREDEGEGDGER